MALLNILVLISIFGVSLGFNEWDSFKDQHGKHYTSDHEEAVRKQIFVMNQGLIEEHNQRYDLGLESFSMAMNQFGDLNEEEYRARLLCLNLAAAQGTAGTEEEAVDPLRTRAPEAVDWREVGAVTPVKNQGQCGSCWAFSTTGSLESQLFLKTGKLVSLSEQNLVDCSQSFGNSGCFGGLMENAFQYIQYNGGIDSEQAYPYEAKDNECRFKNESVVTSMSGFVKIPSGDEKTLQSAVAGSGPVSVAIDASGKFQFYGKGVYYNSQCSTLNHAVLAVGYGSESGKDYWLVKNSWGSAWGDKGYIRMSRNLENNCGIATLASYPTLS